MTAWLTIGIRFALYANLMPMFGIDPGSLCVSLHRHRAIKNRLYLWIN